MRFNGPFRVQYLSEDGVLPQLIEPDVVYIGLSEGRPWVAHFKCPCGEHKQMVTLGLREFPDSPDHPSWEFQDQGGLAHLSPSILWTDAIGCHFFIHGGSVQWC
jgi:hypothetical protein